MSPTISAPQQQAIIDSDVDDTSLSSSLCEDYVSNIQAEADLDAQLPTVHLPKSRRDFKPVPHTPVQNPGYTQPASRPSRPFLSRDVERDKQYVMDEATSAYKHFWENSTPGTEYCCIPMPNAKLRLAVHKSSEILGAASVSVDEGRNRHIVLTWNKDTRCELTEKEFLERVEILLEDLFPPSSAHFQPTLTSEERKERKNKARANYLRKRDSIPIHLVEEKVQAKDWEGLDKLFQGMTPHASQMKTRYPNLPNVVSVHKEHIASGSHRYRGGNPSGRGRGRGRGAGRKMRGGSARGGDSRYQPAQPIGESNKGFKMLSNMGWQEGQGLGASEEGRLEPVAPQLRADRAGLGSSHGNRV